MQSSSKFEASVAEFSNLSVSESLEGSQEGIISDDSEDLSAQHQRLYRARRRCRHHRRADEEPLSTSPWPVAILPVAGFTRFDYRRAISKSPYKDAQPTHYGGWLNS